MERATPQFSVGHLFKLVFLLIFVLLFVQIEAQQVNLGSLSLPTNFDSYEFVSQQLKTNLIVETVANGTAPTIQASISGASTTLSSLVKITQNKITIELDSTGGGGGDVVTSVSSVKTIPFTIFSLLVLLFPLYMSRSSTALIVICLICLCFSAHYLEAQNSGVEVTIRLQIPSQSSWESISLQLKEGSVVTNLSGVRISNFNVDMCSSQNTTSASTISLNGLEVTSSLNLCSPQTIQVSNLFLASTKVKVSILSGGDTDISFKGGFAGTFTIADGGNVETTVQGDCYGARNSNGEWTGMCSHGKYSSVRIQSVGKTTANFGAECGADWMEREAVDFAEPSPKVQRVIPGQTISFTNASRYHMTAETTTNGWSFTNTGDNVTLSTGGLTRNVFWVLQRDVLPLMNNPTDIDAPGSFVYRLRFDYARLIPSDLRNNITNVTVVVIDRWEATTMNRDYLTLSTASRVAAAIPLTGNLNNPTNNDWVSVDVTFTTTRVISTPYIAIRFQTSVAPLAGKPYTFFFKNFQFVVPDRPLPTPKLITNPNQLVTSRKPSIELEPQDRTTCPHKQNGLKLWHDPSTWTSGVVPSPSDTIILPASTSVLITSCSLRRGAIYEKIVVPETSELIFSDAPTTLAIRALHVQGKLTLGSKTCRLLSDINITFYGSKNATSPMIDTRFGTKGIGVETTGSIDIHGKQYHYTWTRLAAAARKGDNFIFIQDDVNWEVGQKVVVVTSVRDDEIRNQNEVMTIKAVEGRIIQFEERLAFDHFSSQEYQIEVGLLSRRITLMGDTESLSESFGGHVMIMGKGRISGVMTSRMGQKNQLGRYPLHFHMAGNRNDSYIKDSSFYKNFYRCISIHGTHSALFERNVAFDTQGHCYYIEDGVEENNTLAYNLAAYVHPIYKVAGGAAQTGETYYEMNDVLKQPADVAAAGFYITNAYNRFYGNAASGGWSGYAFPNLYKPIGLFANHPNYQNFNPSGRPNLEFDSNTAHSAGYQWSSAGCIYIGGNLTTNSTSGQLMYHTGRFSRNTKTANNLSSAWMLLTNIKTWLCGDGVSTWGERLDVLHYESYDNRVGATVFGESSVVHAIIQGKTKNPEVTYSGRGFQFYDTFVKTLLANVIFKSFYGIIPTPANVYSDNRALISMTHSDQFKPQGISATRNVTFVDIERKQRIGHRDIDTGSSRYFNFMDWDGTFTDRGKHAIVGNSNGDWWRLDKSCTLEPDWLVWVCDKTSQREIASIFVLIPGLIDASVYIDPADNSSKVGNMCLFGGDVPANETRCSIITRNTIITGVTGVNWFMHITQGTPAYFEIAANQVPYNTSFIFSTRFPVGTTFNITTWYKWSTSTKFNGVVAKVNSLQEVKNSTGRVYYFDGEYLYIKVVNLVITADPSYYYERSGVRIYDVLSDFKYRIQSSCPTAYCSVPFALPSQE